MYRDKTEIRSRDIIPSNYHKLLFLILGIVFVIFGIVLLPGDHHIGIIGESGVIENAQFLGYMACAVLSWVFAKKKLWQSGLSGGIIFLAFALRELDFQKRFTVMSITKTSFFMSPDVSLNAKLISGVLIISLLVIFCLFLKKNTRHLLTGFQADAKWAFSACAGIILLFAAVTLDKGNGFLKDFGMGLMKFESLRIKFTEEIVELAIPVFFLMALFQWRKAALKREK